MSHLEKTQLHIGYIPLLDCIALLWAKQRGFFDDFGLDVTLVKEASWASLRDRLAFGILDAAHCLSAMLPAAAVGEDQIGIQLKTPLVLSINRAYISLSQKLSHDLRIQPADTPFQSAYKLVQHLHAGHPVHLAHVFNHSIHHYCLREWIALADPSVAQDIVLKTLPPPYMVEAISSHAIDGFCVGEPWNTQGEVEGVSQIVAHSRDIVPEIADKVLAVTHEWASHHPNTLCALTAAILKAQRELEILEDFKPVWQMLIDFNVIRFQCNEEIHVQKYHALEKIIRHLVLDHTAPKQSDMQWLFEEMQTWQGLNLEQTALQHLSEQCIDLKSHMAARQLLED